MKYCDRKFPIGLRHGLKLLEEANGDLENAEKLFQEEMVALVIIKTGVTTDVAIKHLLKSNYDVGLTVKKY